MGTLGSGHQFDKTFFDEIKTPQQAYVIGLLQCDGAFSCKTKDKENYYRYKISLQEGNIDIIKKIMKVTNHTGKLTTQKRRLENQQNLLELSFNGIETTKKLKKHFGGFVKTDRTLIPEMKNELMRHYLRGVYDADGSLGDYSGVMLRLDGKYDFLQKIKEIVRSEKSISKGNGRTTYNLRLTGKEAIKVADFMYGGLSYNDLYIERKYQRFCEVMEQRNVPFKEAV